MCIRDRYYTQDEVREVVAYAAERKINIIPEIDMPGHFVAAIACYPELSCTGEQVEVSDRWGVLDNIACCGKENIYNFVKDVIDEDVYKRQDNGYPHRCYERRLYPAG